MACDTCSIASVCQKKDSAKMACRTRTNDPVPLYGPWSNIPRQAPSQSQKERLLAEQKAQQDCVGPSNGWDD